MPAEIFININRIFNLIVISMFGLGKDKTIQEGLYALSIAILVAGIVLSFSIVYAANTISGNFNTTSGTAGTAENQQAQPQQNQPEQQPQEQDTVQVSADNDPVKGNENAPVTIIEFSEFQCPFAGRFARDTLPSIMTNYIDTGKVKFVYRDFVVHSSSQKAQEAAACADEQGKFWEYHDILYENQGALDDESLKGYAEQAGLDTNQFNSCFNSRKYKSEVEKDTSDGRTGGVSGTPTFFINGKKFVGAQPYDAFRAEIEAALAG